MVTEEAREMQDYQVVGVIMAILLHSIDQKDRPVGPENLPKIVDYAKLILDKARASTPREV